MDLLDILSTSYRRHELKSKRVAYRTRWSTELRGGTITKVTDVVVWISDTHCLHHDDLLTLREMN